MIRAQHFKNAFTEALHSIDGKKRQSISQKQPYAINSTHLGPERDQIRRHRDHTTVE